MSTTSGNDRVGYRYDEQYTPPFEFNGKIAKVTVDLK